MNKVIEKADLDWPDGATHCIDGLFLKWAGGVFYDYIVSGYEVSYSSYTLDDYIQSHQRWTIYSRPSKTVSDVITQNDALLDAYDAMKAALKGFERYTDPKPYFKCADGVMTIMQEDCGQDAIESAKALKSAMDDIEEHINVQAGRVAHG